MCLGKSEALSNLHECVVSPPHYNAPVHLRNNGKHKRKRIFLYAQQGYGEGFQLQEENLNRKDILPLLNRNEQVYEIVFIIIIFISTEERPLLEISLSRRPPVTSNLL